MAWGDKGGRTSRLRREGTVLFVYFLAWQRWIFRRGCGDFGGVRWYFVGRCVVGVLGGAILAALQVC